MTRKWPGVVGVALAVGLLLPPTVSGQVAAPAPDQPSRPTFRTGVDLVSVAAVVHDRRGQVVRNLSRDDFVVFDKGVPRPIVEFSAGEDGPVSVAVLFDVSGSMAMASSLAAGRRALDHLMSWLNPGVDEVGLFAFDKQLHDVQGFTTNPDQVRTALSELGAYGMTSLYDAIGQVARRLGDRASRRRAIVVLTDGLDNGSQITAGEVSGIASSTDVPVYIIAVVSRLDHAGEPDAVGGQQAEATSTLANLAWWTGGTSFVVSTDAHASVAARTVLAELRHQYVLAFESAATPGWRPLDIRLRRRELTVRARSGYFSSMPAVRPLGE